MLFIAWMNLVLKRLQMKKCIGSQTSMMVYRERHTIMENKVILVHYSGALPPGSNIYTILILMIY